MYETLVLIVNNCASWSESPFDIGITVYSSSRVMSRNILSIAVPDVFRNLVGNVIMLVILYVRSKLSS
jgi:hypothetical protein